MDTYNVEEYIVGSGEMKDLFILLISPAISCLIKFYQIFLFHWQFEIKDLYFGRKIRRINKLKSRIHLQKLEKQVDVQQFQTCSNL